MSGNRKHNGIKQQREELDGVMDTVKKKEKRKMESTNAGTKVEKSETLIPLIVSAEEHLQSGTFEQKLCGGPRVCPVIALCHKIGNNCTCGYIRQVLCRCGCSRDCSCAQRPSFNACSLSTVACAKGPAEPLVKYGRGGPEYSIVCWGEGLFFVLI